MRQKVIIYRFIVLLRQTLSQAKVQQLICRIIAESLPNPSQIAFLIYALKMQPDGVWTSISVGSGRDESL